MLSLAFDLDNIDPIYGAIFVILAFILVLFCCFAFAAINQVRSALGEFALLPYIEPLY